MTPKKSTRDHKRSLPGKCLIDSCSSRRGYRLPAGGALLQEWLTALKLEPGKKPSSKLVICAKHFAPKDFQPAQQSINGTIHLVLTDKAVPSEFLASRKNALPSSDNVVNEKADESTPSRTQNSVDEDVTILSSDLENPPASNQGNRKRKNLTDSQVKRKRKRNGKNSSQSESSTDDEDPPQTLVCKDEDDVYSDDSDVILCEKPVDTVDLTSQPSSPECDSRSNDKSFDVDESNDSDCQIVEEVITLNSDDEEEEVTYTMPLTPVDFDADKYSSNSEDGSAPGTKDSTPARNEGESDSSSFDSSSTSTTSPTNLTPYSARTTDFSWDLNTANGSSSGEESDNDESTVPPDDFVDLGSESSISVVENSSSNVAPCDLSNESCETPDKEANAEGEVRPDNREEANSLADTVEEVDLDSDGCNGRANSPESKQMSDSAIVEAATEKMPEVETGSAEPSSDTGGIPVATNPDASESISIVNPDASESMSFVNPDASESTTRDAAESEPCFAGEQQTSESRVDGVAASGSPQSFDFGESTVTVPNGCANIPFGDSTQPENPQDSPSSADDIGADIRPVDSERTDTPTASSPIDSACKPCEASSKIQENGEDLAIDPSPSPQMVDEGIIFT
ncbi:Hypothetical protein NTJ_15473 [Nesidiocoris tenuis]|uniref:THAP-type domain-containing protein n=1 Tax=Nesidiocoris tenuis TaxID=355587 RepID=A0ABN7BE58_9HEMI|nr:Hypothetical protein NTJ_15473 [Nesidiocoris tenuis]